MKFLSCVCIEITHNVTNMLDVLRTGIFFTNGTAVRELAQAVVYPGEVSPSVLPKLAQVVFAINSPNEPNLESWTHTRKIYFILYHLTPLTQPKMHTMWLEMSAEFNFN